jgi:hypothetical protein
MLNRILITKLILVYQKYGFKDYKAFFQKQF